VRAGNCGDDSVGAGPGKNAGALAHGIAVDAIARSFE
jgi:hypothetical protein